MQSIDDAFNQPIYNDRYDHLSPYENFLFALKSKETKRQYPKLLKMFFDFTNIEPSKSMEERAHILFAKSKEDRRWLETRMFAIPVTAFSPATYVVFYVVFDGGTT